MNLTAISPKERERLNDLLERSGLKSQVDLINEALNLYEYMLTNLEKGGSLPFQDMGDVIKEIAIGSFLEVQRERNSKQETQERGSKKSKEQQSKFAPGTAAKTALG